MSFFKNILGKDLPVRSYTDFREWLAKHKHRFHRVVSTNGNVEKDSFDKISPKLDALGDGYFYLTGMADDQTVELIITADGNLKKMIFGEELVNAAPALKGWKILAHKPPLNMAWDAKASHPWIAVISIKLMLQRIMECPATTSLNCSNGSKRNCFRNFMIWRDTSMLAGRPQKIFVKSTLPDGTSESQLRS